MAEIIRTCGVSSRDEVDLDAAITWLTTNHPDFQSDGGNNFIIKVHNDAATMVINSTLPNYNQSAVNNLVIEGVAGTNGTGRPVLISTANSSPTFTHQSQHTLIRNIQFRNTSNTSNSHCFRYGASTGPGNRIVNCSFESGTAGGSHSFEQLQPDTNNKPQLEFCVARNGAQHNYHAVSSAGMIMLYCISENAGSHGVNKLSDFDPIIAINCASYGSGGNDWNGSAAGFAGSLTNASSDTTAPGTGAVNNINPATAYTNTGNEDYSLPSGSPLADVGTDTSTTYSISADVAGTPYAPNYDIGPIAFGTGVIPVAFSGTVSNQSHQVNTPFSLDVASFFSGSEAPFTYALQAGTLPNNITLSGSTLSGTPDTVGTQTGIVIRATDTDTNTADTNAFTIDITATPPTTSDLVITLVAPPEDGTFFVELKTSTGNVFSGPVSVVSGSFTLSGLTVPPGTAMDGLIKNENQINAANGTYIGGVTS